MESRQRRSKVWLYFTRKDDHRATCNACKMSILSKGGNTTILQKHLSIQHAITLQECHVFERYGVTITLMNLNQATAVRLTLALHLLISKVNSYCLLVTLRIHLKKNSTVIGKIKYYLAQRFSNSGISRTPKLPQIRPGRDPYLIRLFSRLPHLMRFLFDVLLQKLYETH